MKVTILLALSTALAFAQGPLTPPGAPAPTMKTLNQLEPRTPISGQFFIFTPGSYYLTQSISNSDDTSNFTITIQSNHVDLDLNGFTVTTVTNSVGAISIGGQHVTIRNGHIVGITNRTAGASPWLNSFNPTGGGGEGILAFAGDGWLKLYNLHIRGLTNGIFIQANGGTGSSFSSNLIAETLIRDCSGQGIISLRPVTVIDTNVVNCGAGITAERSIFERVRVAANNGNGITGNLNTISHAIADSNGGLGFSGTASTYRSVSALSNQGGGIQGAGVNIDGATLGSNRNFGYSGNNSVLRGIKASGNVGPGINTLDSSLTDCVSDNNSNLTSGPSTIPGHGIFAPDSVLSNCRAFGTPSGAMGIIWSRGKISNSLADIASPAIP